MVSDEEPNKKPPKTNCTKPKNIFRQLYWRSSSAGHATGLLLQAETVKPAVLKGLAGLAGPTGQSLLSQQGRQPW